MSIRVSNYSHPIFIGTAFIDISGFTRGVIFIQNFSFQFHLFFSIAHWSHLLCAVFFLHTIQYHIHAHCLPRGGSWSSRRPKWSSRRPWWTVITNLEDAISQQLYTRHMRFNIPNCIAFSALYNGYLRF